MNNNKILTVSYGTFSCTLEGFDDSFGTMKAIAEYFRDLAADDRYFGAEPPQPDAEMLARIAQNEISRRVEAREHEGKIVLSATNEQAETPRALDAPGAAVAAVAATETLQEPADNAEVPAQDMEDVAKAEIGLQADHQTTDTSTQQEIQHDEDHAEDTAPTDDADAVAAEVVEGTADALAQAVADQPLMAEDENDIVPGQPDAEVEAFFAIPESAEADTYDDVAEYGSEYVADYEVATDPIPQPAQIAADSIAAKLQRIRAVVAQHDDAEAAETDYTEDEHAESSEPSQDLHDALVDDVSFDDDMSDMPAEDTFAEHTPAPVMAPSDVIAEARTDLEEALSADDAAALDDMSEADAEAEADDITDILSRLDASETVEAEAEAEQQDAETLIADIAAAEMIEEQDAAAVENLFDQDAPEIADIAAVMAQEDDAPTDADADDFAGMAETDASEDLSVDPSEASDDADMDEDEDAIQPQMPRARVIKVKRADLEAAIERGELEEYDDDDADDDTAASTPALDDLAPARVATSSLSAEEEADLARELADLEADIAQDHDDASRDEPQDADQSADSEVADPTSDPLEDAQEHLATATEELAQAETALDEAQEDPQIEEISQDEISVTADESDAAEDMPEDADAPRRAKLQPLGEDSSDDVDRLLAEAEQQMDEPESATRRDAFAHLRAAVAAKKADEALGSDADDEVADDAYRSDLADVVRPRRPVSGSTRTQRPGEGRPAPLKLVAEQRIDVERPSVPVQPRRVAALDDDTPAPNSDAESFAEFAAEMGATKLPELLEAAAAYMSFVEGREQFSRPQLMTKVRQVGPEGFSREDGLRSFGQLLRAGKIEKIKGGRFTVSDDIGFRPDARAAG
ncbi:hypothetical protein H9Q16_00420 [Sulfitobacter sp. TSTF-M16]|uniref:Chemotaxis protein CheA n=2 Tax=Sulfitobacter aestuariivivens TaxID=2766981 RepID=A0A927D0V8_9RHOB|nr:hypothetical protein [Sulfitobacter aestuariivivens]